MQVEQIRALKWAARRALRQRLASLHPDIQRTQSQRVWERLQALPIYNRSKYVAVYLSVRGEVDTAPIVEHLLSRSDKVCYVPHTDAETGEMRMLSVESMQDLSTFQCNNKWGILEPPAESIKHRKEAVEERKLDLIIVPGLAFTRTGLRLGKGKGYYDRYITRAEHMSRLHSLPRPYFVALGFNEQLEDNIPVLPHDQRVDLVITPNETIALPPTQTASFQGDSLSF